MESEDEMTTPTLIFCFGGSIVIMLESAFFVGNIHYSIGVDRASGQSVHCWWNSNSGRLSHYTTGGWTGFEPIAVWFFSLYIILASPNTKLLPHIPPRMSSSAYWGSNIRASQPHCADVPLLPCSKPLYSSLWKTNVYFAPPTDFRVQLFRKKGETWSICWILF